MRALEPRADNVGDVLPAAQFNVNLRKELQDFVTKAGFTLDPELGPDFDQTMLQRAAAMHACTPGMYKDASVAANNFVIERVGNLATLGDFYKDGQFLFFKAAFTNTSTCTLKVDGVLLPIPLTFPDGTDLTQAAILKGRFSLVRYNGTDLRWELILSSHPILPQSHITGMILSNDPGDLEHDINFSVGQARASNAPFDLHFNTALTKRIDETWAAGDNVGGLFGVVTVVANTWYHAFIIRNDVTGVLDAGFNISQILPLELPAGWSVYKRVGSVFTDASANIIPFFAEELAGGGCEFEWDQQLPSVLVGPDYSAAQLTVLAIPPGLLFKAKIVIAANAVSFHSLLIKPPYLQDASPTNSNFTFIIDSGTRGGIIMYCRTNVTQQISYRSSSALAMLEFLINTLGWIDERND